MRPLFAVILLAAAVLKIQAAPLMSQKEALALAFPAGVTVERKTAYLSDEQIQQAQTAGQVKIASRVWSYYVGTSTQGPTGYAYFDTHVVRTMTETFMAVVDCDGRLRFVELLAFAEPEDYKPGSRWLAQFKGRPAREGLWVGRTIRNMTGASLTSQSMTDGVRRVLAVHALLHPEASGAVKP